RRRGAHRRQGARAPEDVGAGGRHEVVGPLGTSGAMGARGATPGATEARAGGDDRACAAFCVPLAPGGGTDGADGATDLRAPCGSGGGALAAGESSASTAEAGSSTGPGLPGRGGSDRGAAAGWAAAAWTPELGPDEPLKLPG